jgi:Fusaric acid resistance protein-like
MRIPGGVLTGAGAALAALLAFAAVVPIVVLGGQPGRLLVFAVVVAMQISRRLTARSLRGQLAALAALPVIGLVTALYGDLLVHDRGAGDVLIVVSMYASFAARRAPPAIARATRLLIVPVVVLFVAPVPVNARGGTGVLWYLAVSLVAGACVVVVERVLAATVDERLLRRRIARFGELARAADPAQRHAGRLRRAGAELDAQLADRGSDEDVLALRVALLEAELGAASGDGPVVGAALARLKDAVRATALPGRAGSGSEPELAPPTPSGRRLSPTTRIAGQSALAMAAALVISQWLFPDHWSWTVVSVLAISGGLRSRGAVLLRSGERLLGALAGTLVATLFAAALGGHTIASIAAILVLLAVGASVREVSYVGWAFCVTSMLALLYGLYGEHGTHLLGERLVQNVIGALCVILPSYFLLPIRTEALVRRRLAVALAALGDLLAGIADDAPAPELTVTARTSGRRVDELDDAGRPALYLGRGLRALGRKTLPRAARLAEAVRASEDPARALVFAGLTGQGRPSRQALGILRRNLGEVRRTLAGRGTETLGPLPEDAGDVARLNAALRSLHASLEPR